MSITADLPFPECTPDAEPYWVGLTEGRLLLQTCGHCGKIRHYPRPLCDACYSMDVTWTESTRRGRLFSWTVAHHAFHPAFKDRLPYTLAMVELEEGVRVNVQLQDSPSAMLMAGLPVVINISDLGGGLILPVASLSATPDAQPNQNSSRQPNPNRTLKEH